MTELSGFLALPSLFCRCYAPSAKWLADACTYAHAVDHTDVLPALHAVPSRGEAGRRGPGLIAQER